ncbi:predicted protein [Nematostella vectensis]|uniref:Uncharacterized protein n=2 Tax=Nematostella vectensis TaxID=45351 RepID=A7SRI5_NEMVE|nr:predicted protein [Nematostella vectensis]|eukprot:XP_001625780.1 predicted protein [Nematostella vectensis]
MWTTPLGHSVPYDRTNRLYVFSNGFRHDVIIESVNRTDAGLYRCYGNTDSKAVRLEVEYAPELIQSESTTQVTWSNYADRDPIELNCTFDGFPVPTVELYKDSKVITSHVTKGRGSLVYKARAKSIEYYGFYQCTARNTQGEVTHVMEVSKSGPAEPPPHIRLSVGCDYVQVSWNRWTTSRGSAVSIIRIELMQGMTVIKAENLGPSLTSRTYKGLKHQSAYTVRLTAANEIGAGPWSVHQFNTKETCASLMLASSYLPMVLALIVAIVMPQ